MKNISLGFLFISLFLIGCTQNQQESADRPDISLNAGVGVVTGSGDFGQLGPKDSKILTLKITNSGDAPLQGPPQLDNGDFSIVYQSGCSSIAPKKSCTMKILFSAEGKLFQQYSANLVLDTVLVSLSAEVVNPTPNNAISFSVASLDFGTITDKQSVIKTVIITNTGSSKISGTPINIPGEPTPKSFTLNYDTCSNKDILPGKSCLVKVAFKGNEEIGVLSASLSFLGQSLPLSGTVVSSSGSSSLGSPNVQLLINNQVSSSYDFGSLSGTEAKQVIIVAKNNGTKSSEVGTVFMDTTHFKMVFNQCNNQSLAPGAACQIRVLFSAAGKSPNNYSSSLSFAGQSVALSGIVFIPSVACSLANAASNGVDLAGVQAVSGMTPNCVVSACNETSHTLYGLGSNSKRCATLEKVYQLQALSTNSQVRENEYIWANSPFGIAWLYRNQSYANVDGVRSYDIEIDVPYATDFLSSIIFPFSGTSFTGVGAVQSCSLKPLGKIEPNGYCTIISANAAAPHPVGFSVVSPLTGGFNVYSPQTNQTFANTFTYRKLLPTTVPRTAVIGVVRIGVDPGILEGPDNTARGMTLAKKNLDNDQIEYIGPCRVKPDGSTGDPRGVYPWISDGNIRPIRTIGSKVLFTGRGCSSTGSGIAYEKWGLWEYDSSIPQGVNNPRRISRNLTQPGNWPMDEAPKEDMLVLNNKLYFSGASLIANETNGFGDFRRALFEYDPSLPLQQNQDLPNPNPKEILTGYERELVNNSGSSSYPSAITAHNGRIYFLGIYFRDWDSSATGREYHQGVLSYNPALPLSVGDPMVLETSDNPRFEWGYTESQYALWQWDVWPATSFFVDDEYFIFGAKMPRSANPVNNEFDTNAYPGGFPNFDAFLAQLRDDRGNEVTFVHRSSGNVIKPDLCPGICDGRPDLFKKVGNQYLFLSSINNDTNNKRVFAANPTGLPDGSLNIQSFDTNLSGVDVRSDRWNFTINVIGSKAYLPLVPETGKSSLYEFDSTTNTLTRLFFGNFEGKSQNAFAIVQPMQNGDLLFRGQFLDNTLNIYSTTQPLAGTASNIINSNLYQKASGAWWYGFKEDEHFYYFLRAGNCASGGTAAFYVDYATKTRDAVQSLYNHPRYDATRCNGEYRYRAETFILLNNN